MEPPHEADLADLAPLSALRHPVRQRLYQFIVVAGRAISRDEAAASVGVSRSLAAYHLDKLAEQGLVEVSFQRRGARAGPGAGRPAKFYRRAPREFVLRAPPRNYQLLGELLVRAAGDDETGTVRGTLERVACSFGRSLGQRATRGPESVPQRSKLSGLLHVRGYEPYEDEQGTLRLGNCPFEAVANRCPDVVCGLNLRLVEGMLAGLGIRRARAVIEPAADRCCVAITALC